MEIAKGYNIYEIGDQGGLIILVKYNKLSNMVRFTYNNGITWEEITLDEKNSFLNNIVIETSNSHHHFLATGYQVNETQDGKIGVIYSIDFKDYHMRECEGHENPETKKSDYMKFVPHSSKSKTCLLGRTISYTVKKPENRCINPDHYQNYVLEKNCQCTNEDYDCDVDFIRNSEGKCVKKDGLEIDFSPPEKCKGTYTVKSGYRKNVDNSCVGGVVYKDKVFNCKVSNFVAKVGVS